LCGLEAGKTKAPLKIIEGAAPKPTNNGEKVTPRGRESLGEKLREGTRLGQKNTGTFGPHLCDVRGKGGHKIVLPGKGGLGPREPCSIGAWGTSTVGATKTKRKKRLLSLRCAQKFTAGTLKKPKRPLWAAMNRGASAKNHRGATMKKTKKRLGDWINFPQRDQDFQTFLLSGAKLQKGGEGQRKILTEKKCPGQID